MDGRPSLICASYAPNKAAIGSPQRFASSVIRLKYSWNVKRILWKSPPADTILATEVSTAYSAP